MIKPKENILIRILQTNCVPRLTYGAAVKDLKASERRQNNLTIYNAVRRIFHFLSGRSTRQNRDFYGLRTHKDDV